MTASLPAKKISVIVPVYNCEQYIGRCIQSILYQTYPCFELLLINDGSSDHSEQVCREYQQHDERIHLFTQPNSGASKARNTGIEQAKGEYLMFVDADDWIEPNMLERLLEEALKHQADLVMCNMSIDYHDASKQLRYSRVSPIKERVLSGKADIARGILDLVERERINGPCCKLMRSAIIHEHGIRMPENMILQEDLQFMIDVLEHVETMAVLKDCLYHYVKGISSSVTSRYYPNKLEMTGTVHNRLLAYYERLGMEEEILARIRFIMIKNIYAAFLNLFHQDCNLTRREKLKQIEDITHASHYRTLIIKANRTGLKYAVLKQILVVGDKYLLYCFGKFLHLLKYKYGFHY